jgi:phage terminase large subunit-like protein
MLMGCRLIWWIVNRQEKIELLRLLEERKRRDEINQLNINYASLYDWQKRFIAATVDNRSCMLMAANRVGKTRTGLTVDAYHLTGNYPDDWTGHRFEHAPRVWLLGFSMEKTRDLLQQPLFGRLEGAGFMGGLIHKDLITGHFSAQGTSGAMREVRVKHRSGGESICQFWSYSQGQHAIMGDSVDWYHIDEEPRDKAIYPQVLTRTATGDKGRGGRGILTFTPENGRTELVVQFMDNPGVGQYMQRATWNDAPHLTDETKEQLLSGYPEWQRDMRTKGLPLLGTGLIFDIKIPTCKAFPCPDHWYVINGMDFGWDHPQAHCQLLWDKDEDVIYVSKLYRKSKQQPYEVWHNVKSWARNVPTAWPSDGLQTEKGSGKSQKSYYEEAGWSMLSMHAQWPDGGVSVEQGLMEMYDRFKTGKLVIFDHLSDLLDELMQYHRDEKGSIVKVADDAISAVRYAYMMRRFAETKYDILNQPEYHHEERNDHNKTGSLGY